MKESRYGRSRFSKFLKSNGVFLALAVGLLAVGGVAIAGIQTSNEPSDGGVVDEPVEQLVTGQPDDRITTSSTTTTTESTTTTSQTESAPDLYVLPLTNTVQKPFSVEAPLYSVTMNDWRIHTGVDFAGEEGQTVKAVARGTVLAVEQDELWGNVITIDHGVGVQSRYCGVKSCVEVGEEVDASTPIGALVSIPCEASQPAHLHFEMTVDGMPVDPVAAIALEVRYADTTE